MNRTEKYTSYFMAQAHNKLPNQRGGKLGTVLTLNKALDWVNKFCDIASTTAKIVSPVQQVADQVKREIERESEIKHSDKANTTHKPIRQHRKRTRETRDLPGHLLIKKIKQK